MIINVNRTIIATAEYNDGIAYVGSLVIAGLLSNMGLEPFYGLGLIDDTNIAVVYNFGEKTEQYVVLVSDGKVESWRRVNDTWRKEQ